MRIVVQRVKQASCKVNNELISAINNGFLIFVGIEEDDNYADMDYMIKKISNLRIFHDKYNKMNLSIHDVEAEILSISQFTLMGDVRKGNRPSFSKAMSPDKAYKFFLEFNENLRKNNIIVKEGVFGADMQISLVNDGPVTILLDSKKIF